MGLIQLILILPSLCVFHILCMDCSNKLQPGDHCKKLEKNKGCRCKFLSLLPVQCRQSPFLATCLQDKIAQCDVSAMGVKHFIGSLVLHSINLCPPSLQYNSKYMNTIKCSLPMDLLQVLAQQQQSRNQREIFSSAGLSFILSSMVLHVQQGVMEIDTNESFKIAIHREEIVVNK